MTTQTNIELGSIIYNLIENVPTLISGLLVNGFLVNQSVFMVENYTGENISTNAIVDTYQPPIINLTISQVLGQMEAQGIGTKSVSIGELSISKGMVEGTSQSFKQLAYNQLNDLPKKVNYYQTRV